MSSLIEITTLSGNPPFEVYVSDFYGNHEEYLDTVYTSAPPTLNYMLSTGFTSVPMVKLKIIDASGCTTNQNIICT